MADIRKLGENLSNATDQLLDCLAEFGAEAHLYCSEHVNAAQTAQIAFQQATCEHEPQRLPGGEDRFCVKCGIREDAALEARKRDRLYVFQTEAVKPDATAEEMIRLGESPLIALQRDLHAEEEACPHSEQVYEREVGSTYCKTCHIWLWSGEAKPENWMPPGQTA